MKDKKIVMAIPSMTGGGAERVMSILANSLVQNNQVYLLTISEKNSFYNLDNEVNYISYGLKVSKENKLFRMIQQIVYFPLLIKFYSKEIKSISPDIAISFLYQTNIILILVKLLTRNLKLIISERNDPFNRNKYLQKFLLSCYKHADVIVCQSNTVKKYYEILNKVKVIVIPNPLDSNLLPKYDAQIKRENSIVAVGRLFHQKNYPLLLESFKLFSNQISGFYLKIYGSGPELDNLKKIAEQLGIIEKVIFMGARKDVLKLIQNSKLYVMTSFYEGFPNSLIEAMAIGLPVIATDFSTGVARELISEENGVVVPLNDKIKLSDAMIKIIESEEMINRMSKNNIKIRDILDKDKVIGIWESVIEEIVPKRQN